MGKKEIKNPSSFRNSISSDCIVKILEDTSKGFLTTIITLSVFFLHTKPFPLYLLNFAQMEIFYGGEGDEGCRRLMFRCNDIFCSRSFVSKIVYC